MAYGFSTNNQAPRATINQMPMPPMLTAAALSRLLANK
jgi:hypothetical protein